MSSPANELFEGWGQTLTLAPERWAPWMATTDGSTRGAAEIRCGLKPCGVYPTVCPGYRDRSSVPIQAVGQREPDESGLGPCLDVFCNLLSLQLRHKAGPRPGGESEHHQPQRVMVFQHFNYKAVGENSPPDVQQEIELHKHGRHIPAQLP